MNALTTRKLTAIPDDTYDYGNIKPIAWIKGERYEAADDGDTLMLAVEPGGQVYVVGRAREWFLEHFTLEEATDGE